jgi:hypothetical protein
MGSVGIHFRIATRVCELAGVGHSKSVAAVRNNEG